MLSILQIALENAPEKRLTNQKASLLQGIIMEQIDTGYAEVLHQNNLRPYSQSIVYRGEKCIWQIKTLNEEAYEKIILRLLRPEFQWVYLEHDDSRYKILHKELQTVTCQKLLERYYFGVCSRYLKIRFCTPTSFKSDGKYLFYPDLRLVFQSLINRYDAFSQKEMIAEEEILDQLVGYTQIVQYQLKSVSFPMEGIKIPAFMGTIFLRMNGPQQLTNLATMLFQYGVYAGVGIKTAIGMGAIEIIQKGTEDDGERM